MLVSERFLSFFLEHSIANVLMWGEHQPRHLLPEWTLSGLCFCKWKNRDTPEARLLALAGCGAHRYQKGRALAGQWAPAPPAYYFEPYR